MANLLVFGYSSVKLKMSDSWEHVESFEDEEPLVDDEDARSDLDLGRAQHFSWFSKSPTRTKNKT